MQCIVIRDYSTSTILCLESNKPNNTNVVYFKAYLQIVEVNDVVIYSAQHLFH